MNRIAVRERTRPVESWSARRWIGCLTKPLLVVFVLAGTAAGQRTWVVDDTMAAGADFGDLVSAYNAAAPNDRIFVRRGSGAGYAFPAGVNRPIRILGETGGVKPILYYPPASISCPANEITVISNFEIRPVAGYRWLTSIANSPGMVVLSLIDYHNVDQAITPYLAHRVVLADCIIQAIGTSLRTYRSEVWLLNCRTSSLTGAISSQNGNIEVRDGSFLRIVGGSHVGGDGLAACLPLQPGYPGKPAVWMQGPVIVAGPAVLTGGVRERYNPTCNSGSNTIRVGGITLNCLPWSVIDPMVSIQAPPRTPLCASDLVREMPAVIPGRAIRGQPQSIDVYGPVNALVAVFASFLPAFDPIVLPIGDVWLDPSLTVHVASGGFTAARRIIVSTTIPNWLPVGDVLVYQAASLSPQGSFELSQPGIAVVH